MTAAAPIFCPRFIGREKELALIMERARAAAGGSGALLLIGGEAGIGKTRLLATARNGLEESGVRIALGQCLEHAQSPLGPLAEALGELHAIDPSVLSTDARLRAALSRLVASLAGGDVLSGSLSDDRRSQYGAIADALRRFSDRHPTVVAIEDAHWADLATLEFLTYLAPRLSESKLLLLVTYRADELHRRHPLTSTMGKLTRTRTTWQADLPALSRAEMHSFFAHALEGKAHVPRALLHEIQELVEGNPLFTEELLRQVVAAPSEASPRKLPLTVRAAVLERSASLNDDARTMLACAALIGRKFDVELLARISGLSEAQITAHLRRARELHLIVEEGSGYVFRHALIQEAFYAELLAAEARPLHARAVRELELLPESDDRVMELAYHSWAAKDPQKAARYSEAAGDVAAARLAHSDAAQFYERALELGADDAAAEAALYQKLGRALDFVAFSSRARRAFERAFAAYEKLADEKKCAELAIDLAREDWSLGEHERSLHWRRRALDLTQPFAASPLRLQALTEMIATYALAGDPEGADPYLEEAAGFTGTGWPDLARYHNYQGIIEGLRGNLAEMHDNCERAIALAAQITNDAHQLCNAYNNAGYTAMRAGEIDLARTWLGQAVRFGRERFLLEREAYSVAGLAELEALAGNLEAARNFVLDSAALSLDSEAPFIRLQQTCVAISLGTKLEDAELIERFAHEEIIELAFATGEAQRFGGVAAAFAELYAQREEPERGRDLLHRAVAETRAIATVPALAIAVARYGDEADFPRMRELLERWARPALSLGGQAYRALFEALVAQQTGSDARRLGEEAARRFAAIGFPVYEALGLEAAGRPGEALQIYRRIGDKTGARRLEARVDPRNRRGRSKRELTLREREVAELVGQGKSNRTIADALSLSERTVEHHVAAILAKLGVESRAQIVATVAREGLAAQL